VPDIASQHVRNATHENFCPVTIETAPMIGRGLIARPAERPVNGHPARTGCHFRFVIDFT
jgi:hypothetical protein